MGVDTRRPMLPAPTESIVTTGGSTIDTELATDISRRTDKTSYSIPDDGSPVTISTRRRHREQGDDSKLSRASQHSQTSLLIEYFEGGKGSSTLSSRPSIRVRVTPSSARKSKGKDHDDQIQISESSPGNRKPAYTRRISLSSPSKPRQLIEAVGDDNSITSSNSAADENQSSSRHPPLEIEFVNRYQGSQLSGVSRDRYIPATSDISTMPPDSMLEASSAGPRRKRSQSLEREQSEEPKVYLKTPSRQRSRSLSTERIAHRVAEKLSNEPHETPVKRTERRRGNSNNNNLPDADPKSSRRHLSAYRDEDMASPESSLLSASAVSPHRKSGDQYSFRSGTSKSSLNNPRLLETVEDAIRRLILPELKELKKDQKVISNTSKFEREVNASSYSSASSPSRDGLGRRLSKHASAPDVMKPKVVLKKDSKDEGTILSGEPTSTKQERRTSRDSETTSDATHPLPIWGNRPDLTEQDKLRRQRSKGLRDAEKAAIVGTALTAAALMHHDSDKNEGGRKGINETELVFQKHNVAPMPLRSAIESDMTRDSLVSERTAETSTPPNNFKVQDISRGSPPQVSSPTSRTPTRTPLDPRYELGLKHSNLSNHNLSIQSASDHGLAERGFSPGSDAAGAGAIAAAAAANLLGVHSDRQGFGFNDNPRRRTLSPIQSVASNQSGSHLEDYPTRHDERQYSEGERELEPRLSIESLSSAPSTNLARSTRQDGLSVHSETLRHQDEIDHDLGYEETPIPSPLNGHWREASEIENEHNYRHSMAETDTDSQRLNNYADDSEIDFMDQVHQGQRVAEGAAAIPQYVHPIAVESAVASLLDPSILSPKSDQSGANRSQPNLPQHSESGSPSPAEKEIQGAYGSRQGSPLKQRQDASSLDETSFPRRMGVTSPPQSITQSLEDPTEPHLYADELHDAESPNTQAYEHDPDLESEINTNPSIIQGPAHENSWPYNHTPPKVNQSPLVDHAEARSGSAGLVLGSIEQADYDKDYYPSNDYDHDDYYDQQYAGEEMFGTPPGAKDEGYVSAANPLSPGVDTPEPVSKGFGGVYANGMGLFDSPTGADDPLAPSHQRHLSGYSHGVGSPLYDSATGRGIERIQSQDIIALMDHLTVRDAQRNARDTEILVTLVRSAAEMRNSFEEMKKFIAQQDGMLMEASDKQHERTYRALNGPRPLPPSGSRNFRQSTAGDAEDLSSKRKSVFKRALKSLSLKSSNDLTKIEEMLEQLLEEVEALRANQDGQFMRSGNRAASVDPDGYEPEGQAGTSSPGTHSGNLSTSSRPVYDTRGNGARAEPVSRVSTVPEADEDMQLDERGEFLSPNTVSSENANNRQVPMASGALSNETSPKMNEKARKHKSSSSSFFPKISRWSKTTASSMGDNIRNSIQPGRKEGPSLDASQSGDLAHGPYKTGDYYDPQGDDRLRSTYTLDDSQQQENRPPSPLVPSQVSETPKYRAHRDSLDLQHPQPRQGPTGRYQSQLETQAQAYGPDQWGGSNPSLSAVNPNQNRYSNASRLSPISDTGYSQTSSRQGPPRPPKVKDDGPLVPERPQTRDGDERSYAERVASRSSAIRSPHTTPSPRKPTGPRPLNSGSQYSPNRRKQSNYRGSPDQVDELDY